MEESLTRSDSRHHDNSYVSTCTIRGAPIVSLITDGKERLCLAQISNDLLKDFSYNEIHNRRVALGITCVQCTPVQLELLRRAGAMPSSSRRCGMITRREAERLVNSFLESTKPLNLPENFVFEVYHHCAWGCRGLFIPIRYNSSRAKCIRCSYCDSFLSPNKFIFHSHRLPNMSYVQPDSPNFNAWRRHLRLHNPTQSEDLRDAWEDVKAMFNGGNRKRTASATTVPKSSATNHNNNNTSGTTENIDHAEEMNDEDKEETEEDDGEKHEDKEIEVDDEEEEVMLPIPPPPKLSKTKTRERRLPTHNVVSSTTTDEQLPDINMFLPPPPPPPLSIPSLPGSHYFPFPPPLPSSNPLSLVSFNSTDWLQFFRSPLFVPSSFRLPLSTIPRRFPFEINNQNPSIIGSGSHSAFKPPIQKNE
ncbi:unnamed protein product [Adineta ricciae]|uniref:c-SKI SMAD4-binding domain-containing protein n=1 Tax=Adineta ricciae TaxID=249248 RepID=A0A813WIH6_ADIRI|nr:unnamed protein product [Adineta ricciae]CAF1121995.1 unnamed protein product [Adineta ricciae]